MALTAKNNNMTSNIPPLESGIYPARLVNLVDLGKQAQRPYMNQEKPPADSVMLTYELLDEFVPDEDGNPQEDKPRFLSEDFPNYTRVATQSTACARIKALDVEGNYEGFHPDMLGKPVMLTVTQNPSKKPGDDRVFVNVTGVAPMRSKDAENAGPLVNQPTAFDFDEPDLEGFQRLPEFVQKRVKQALNYEGSPLAIALGEAEANNKPSQTESVGLKASQPMDDEDVEHPY